MDWQDSGASPLKPLTDEELAAALQGLSTEAAMKLLEEQAELRNKQAELEAVVKQRENLLAKEEILEQTPAEDFPEVVKPAEVTHGDFTLDLGYIEEIEPQPTAETQPEDIAASLNALYGAASVQDVPAVAAVEEIITEAEESSKQNSNLVDDLILQFGGEEDEPEVTPAKKVKIRQPGRSAWSLIANWNGSGALIVAMLMGYTFAGVGNTLGSLAAGGFVAFVVIGLIFAFSALAARRGNAYQQILARSAFGVTGNVIPATVLLIARIVSVAIALLCGALAVGVLLPGLKLSGSFDIALGSNLVPVPLVVTAGLLVIVTALAWIRGKAIEVARVVIMFLSLGLIVAVFAIAEIQQRTDYRESFAVDLYPSLSLASSLIVVFGLLFAITSGDENRRIRPTTVIPKFVAAGLLNWTLAGTAALAAGFVLATLDLASVAMLPVAVAIAVLGVFSLATLIAQTSNQLVGLRIPEPKLLLRIAISLLILGIAVWLYLTFSTDVIWQSLWQLLPAAGTPVAAWLGIFTADVLLRKTDYHLVSLDKNYGFYRGWNFFNLAGWLLATALGLGFIKSDISWLSFTGYLAHLFGEQLASANLGVWVSLVFGFLVPIIFTIPRIRRQEAETLAIEARRQELSEVLGEPEL